MVSPHFYAILFPFFWFLGYAKLCAKFVCKICVQNLCAKFVYTYLSKSHSTQSDPSGLPSLCETIKK